MFTLLKIVKAIVFPPTMIAVGIGASIFLFARRKERWAKRILLLTFLVYYALATGPLSYLSARGLERIAMQLPAASNGSEEAIVILAGGADQKGGLRTFDELGGTSWRRLWRGIVLYRALGERTPLLYAGGSGDPFIVFSPEAALAREYAMEIGIPKERFWVEDISRDTYESARAVRRILDERFGDARTHRIVLVTSAQHTPRAYWTMRKAGIDVVVAPADFRADIFRWNVFTFLPSAHFFSSSMTSINEWAGIGIYWLRGRL